MSKVESDVLYLMKDDVSVSVPMSATIRDVRVEDGCMVKSLNLRWSPICHINWVNKLPELETLNIEYTQVEDCLPLANHPALKILIAKGAKIHNVSPLVSVPTLETVKIDRAVSGVETLLSSRPDLEIHY